MGFAKMKCTWSPSARSLLTWTVMMIAIALATPVAANAEDPLPWTLRDHYSFTGQNCSFSFDVKSAEWKLDVDGLGAVLKNVKAEVILADGRVLRLSPATHESDSRETVSGPMGEGTLFRTTFAPQYGLAISCSVTSFKDAPFLVLRLEAKNTGKEPVEIAAIRPAVMSPTDHGSAAQKAKVTRLETSNRANFAVFHGKAEASLYQIDISKPKISIGLGILQTGSIDSRIDIRPAGDAWQGAIECRFDPPIRVDRGKTIQADPVWVSYGVLKANEIRQFYTWAQSTLPGARQARTMPDSWIAIEGGLLPSDLSQVAKEWSNTPVHHVLAPFSWESKSNSMQDVERLHPKTMKLYVQDVRNLGMKPGLTFDPLLSDVDKGDWSIAWENAHWLNPAHKKAKAYGQERIAKLVNWGVQFFVVPPSAIPDEVLVQFNLTRQEADVLAFKLVVEAAGVLPVMPSPALTIGDDSAQWRQAAESTRYLREYGVLAGPVRLDAGDVKRWSDDLSAAILAFDGPVEIVGTVTRGVRKDLCKIMKAKAETGAKSYSAGK